jgi:hypothetical protein
MGVMIRAPAEAVVLAEFCVPAKAAPALATVPAMTPADRRVLKVLVANIGESFLYW